MGGEALVNHELLIPMAMNKSDQAKLRTNPGFHFAVDYTKLSSITKDRRPTQTAY